MNAKTIITVVAFVVFSTSAFFNRGFYHPDEHYQIVEFAELKTGRNQQSDLAWEYQAKIRSAVQPAIFYIFVSALRWAHISDPHLIMMTVRLITAWVALVMITIFVGYTEGKLRVNLRLYYRMTAFFLCFVPFTNVRFSSENLSALAFLGGLILLYQPRTGKIFFGIGLCLGMSFLFRFQTIFMSAGLLSWLFFIDKIAKYQLINLMSGILLMVNLGALVDYWFYGSFTYSFTNYFTANVVNDTASGFGIYPWYYYLQAFVSYCSFPVAGVVIATIIASVFFKPKELLLWIVTPFLLIHFLVPHKELRFLFPITNLLPLMLMLSFQEIYYGKRIGRYLLIPILPFFLLANLIVLAVNICAPADEEGRINITSYIDKSYKYRLVTLYYFGDINPYRPINVRQQFYLNKNVSQVEIEAGLPWPASVPGSTRLLVMQRRSEADVVLKGKRIKYIYSGVPLWIQKIKKWSGYGSQATSLELYETD